MSNPKKCCTQYASKFGKLRGGPGQGNGNPLQSSCLENPMERRAWWATVHHGDAKSCTWLRDWAQPWPQDWKRPAFIPVPKKGNAKECSNYHTIAFISHGSKVILKILHARLQQYMNRDLPDVQAWFRKGRGARDQIANIHWITEKAREFQKNICFTDYTKAFDVGITNCGKFLKRWEYQTTLPAS